MQVPPATLQALLDHWPVGHLATLTPSGHPHLLPVVFVAHGATVYSPVDGKRKHGGRLARVRNVETHGRASLLLDEYDPDWARLWWLRIDGAAWMEHPPAARGAELAQRLQAKYPQYRHVDVFAGEPAVLALRIERVAAWAQSGSAETLQRAAAAAADQSR